MNGRRAGIVMLILAVAACGGGGDGPTVRDAWVRAVPPERPMTAAYFVIENPTDRELVIRSAASSGFERVELHTSTEEGGVSRMRPVDAIRVPPGDTVRLAPGGLHVMLIGAAQPIDAGDAITIELDTESHGALRVEAPVQSQAPAIE